MDDKGPPLPFQTIEGYGGGGITPFAYLVNPGKEECLWGKPATALTFIDARQKDLFAVTASETLFARIELSYGGDRLGLGTLPADIRTSTGSASRKTRSGCKTSTSGPCCGRRTTACWASKRRPSPPESA